MYTLHNFPFKKLIYFLNFNNVYFNKSRMGRYKNIYVVVKQTNKQTNKQTDKKTNKLNVLNINIVSLKIKLANSQIYCCYV